MSKFQDIPYKWRMFITYALVALGSAFVTAALLIVFGSNGAINYSSKGYDNAGITKLQEIYDQINANYIGEFDDEVLFDTAAQALVLATGDQWSYYMNAEEYVAYQQRLNNAYEGIGVTVNSEQMDKGFLIEKVDPNGGAAAAGIKAGDWITHVEGEAVYSMSTSDAQSKIRGQGGTKVKLTINRDGTNMEVEVTRGLNTSPVATGQMLDNNVGLITITNFNERCYNETTQAIKDLEKQGAKALIFDVRNNPGGYKSELVKLLDYLLEENLELFRSETKNGKQEVDRSQTAQMCKLPAAVLVNKNSYSAAEFFAASLVEYKRAITVGEHTTGKGYFQVDIELSDGSALHLSVGKFTTPKGVNLAEVGGIAPTYDVELTKDQTTKLAAGELAPQDDPQVQKAVEELLKMVK